MSDVKNSEEFIPSDYIAAIDTWVWFNGGEPKVEVYDAIYRAVKNGEDTRKVGVYKFGSMKSDNTETSSEIIDATTKPINSHKGFYLGELVSSMFETSLMNIDINIYDYNGIPVNTTGVPGDENNEYSQTRGEIKDYDERIVWTAIGDD